MNLLDFLTEYKEVLTLFGLLLTLGIFVWQSWRNARLERQENYVRLELASNELFRFEADKAAVLAHFDDLVPPAAPLDAAADRVARCFYFMTLNLFEVSIRLRSNHARTVAPEIFGSWVAWFYDTLTSWYFRQEWPDLRRNYTRELRLVFDPFVEKFDPAEDDEARRRRFFVHVGDKLHCKVIERWLD